jgi:thiamine pyrophosphate-dependent acetolactate synthase large subunit-like protein
MMQRYDYLRAIAADAGDALAVSTGWASREWWAVRPGDGNLKTRTLGLVSSIAAGLAIALPHRKVIAIDGDGAFLMNLCGLPTIARQRPGNLIHLLFDNEIFEASGGTATASRDCDAVALAKGAGYKHARWVQSLEEFRGAFVQAAERNELTLLAVKVEPGQPPDLPPLKLDEIENKYRFMRYLEATEHRGILNPGFDSKIERN